MLTPFNLSTPYESEGVYPVFYFLVPLVRFELTRLSARFLKPPCIPFHHRGNYFGAPCRDRTDSIPVYKTGAPPLMRTKLIVVSPGYDPGTSCVSGKCSKPNELTDNMYPEVELNHCR